jgi:hypothetical protein
MQTSFVFGLASGRRPSSCLAANATLILLASSYSLILDSPKYDLLRHTLPTPLTEAMIPSTVDRLDKASSYTASKVRIFQSGYSLPRPSNRRNRRTENGKGRAAPTTNAMTSTATPCRAREHRRNPKTSSRMPRRSTSETCTLQDPGPGAADAGRSFYTTEEQIHELFSKYASPSPTKAL